MKPVTRRSIIAGSAAAVTALPTLGLCKDATKGGELAALIRRYLKELNQFDKAVSAMSDEEWGALAKATYERTLNEMRDMPVRTKEDALAVVDLLLAEDAFEIWVPAESFAVKLRDYLST